jgi:predicted flap endonuclease-1-like 5' DNA nuclease
MAISEIEGIGPAYAAKLEAAGIGTVGKLLDAGAKPSGRKKIADDTGISSALILEWVNHADLMRLNGVGSEYADLLEAAGVDSPAELAQRNAANLATTFQEVVAARPNLVRRIPSESVIAGWVAEAKTLPKVVEH